MDRQRALITSAVVVAFITTGTVAAAVSLGLVGPEERPSPAGDVESGTVTSSVEFDSTSSSAGPARVEVRDGMVHIYEADGSVVSVPLPVGGPTTVSPGGGRDDG